MSTEARRQENAPLRLGAAEEEVMIEKVWMGEDDYKRLWVVEPDGDGMDDDVARELTEVDPVLES